MYEVWNETDGYPAAPDIYDTEEEAIEFIKEFREKLAPQGYYLNNSMQRIPLDELILLVVPHERGGQVLEGGTRYIPSSPSGPPHTINPTYTAPVMAGKWRAFHDYGAAMNWVEDMLSANCHLRKLTQVKESDMDAYPDLEWPYTTCILVIWIGGPRINEKGEPYGLRPTQRQLLENIINQSVCNTNQGET